jgi:hypothetical protein
MIVNVSRFWKHGNVVSMIFKWVSFCFALPSVFGGFFCAFRLIPFKRINKEKNKEGGLKK